MKNLWLAVMMATVAGATADPRKTPVLTPVTLRGTPRGETAARVKDDALPASGDLVAIGLAAHRLNTQCGGHHDVCAFGKSECERGEP